MNIHEQYTMMMADVKRFNQIKADLIPHFTLKHDGEGEIILDLSWKKCEVPLEKYFLEIETKEE